MPAAAAARIAITIGAGMLPALAVGCAGRARPDASGPTPGDMALNGTQVTLYAELLAAADGRRADTALFRRGLASPSRPVRIEAIRVAGQVHATGMAQALRAILATGDTAVAATAAYALGLMADSGSVMALGAALNRAPTVGVEAAWSLGEIGEPARPVLEAALRAGPAGEAPLAATLTASAKLKPVPAAAVVPYLAADGPRGDPWVLRAAAYALSRRPTPGGARALLDAARDADPETRRLVANGLARPAAGDSLAAPARDALEALVGDSDAYVRAAAVRSLATFGDSARPAVLGVLRDPDPNVRIAAGGVLDRVLGGRRADWVRAFDADTTLAYRREVVAAAVRANVVLEAIDHDNADRWQRQGDWRYRAAAAEAATETPIDRVVDLALPLTRDPDGRVRAVAYGVFAAWLDSLSAGRHLWRRQYMHDALHDADCIVRATALGALAHGATAADGPAALEAYARARSDSQGDARVAAVALLAAAWAADSGHVADSVRAGVAGLSVPADPRELAAAGASSLFASWRTERTGAGDPHPRAWYDSVVRAVVVPALAGRPLRARIETARGELTVVLDGADAPLTVANFAALARAGYYRGTTFHRVVPGFVVQDGDPRGDGNGGPPYAIRDELNRHRYVRGTLGMALSGPDTGGSQYFLTLTPQPHLDGHYTAFGEVIDGYAVLDRLVQGDAVTAVDVP